MQQRADATAAATESGAATQFDAARRAQPLGGVNARHVRRRVEANPLQQRHVPRRGRSGHAHPPPLLRPTPAAAAAVSLQPHDPLSLQRSRCTPPVNLSKAWPPSFPTAQPTCMPCSDLVLLGWGFCCVLVA